MRAKSASKKPVARKRKRKAPQSDVKTAGVLQFRPRTPDDDDYIVQLTENQLGGVHQQAFGEPFPSESFRRYLQSGAPTIVVTNDNKPIGYYSYLVQPDGKMHISAMVIDPKHQSDGIGSKVMRRLETEARKNGVRTLEVFVQTGNAKSLAFTRKLGFVEAFYVTPTTICFQKHLAPPLPQSSPNVATQPVPPQYW